VDVLAEECRVLLRCDGAIRLPGLRLRSSLPGTSGPPKCGRRCGRGTGSGASFRAARPPRKMCSDLFVVIDVATALWCVPAEKPLSSDHRAKGSARPSLDCTGVLVDYVVRATPARRVVRVGAGTLSGARELFSSAFDPRQSLSRGISAHLRSSVIHAHATWAWKMTGEQRSSHMYLKKILCRARRGRERQYVVNALGNCPIIFSCVQGLRGFSFPNHVWYAADVCRQGPHARFVGA